MKKEIVNLLEHTSLLINCDVRTVKIRSAVKYLIVSVAKIKQTIAKEFGTKTKTIIQEEIV